MPIYDYICDSCGEKKLDFFKRMAAPAPECHGPMRQEYQTKVEVFDTSQVFEHVDIIPRRFESKRRLHAFCKANGMTSHY